MPARIVLVRDPARGVFEVSVNGDLSCSATSSSSSSSSSSEYCDMDGRFALDASFLLFASSIASHVKCGVQLLRLRIHNHALPRDAVKRLGSAFDHF
jgi:hypothetical protein